MLYFKFPFDEKLYSTDGKSEIENIQFHSFDQKNNISFKGNICEVNSEDFDKIDINSGELNNEEIDFTPENEIEYLHKLENLIEIIKENKLPKVVLSRRKVFKDFKQIDLKSSFEKLCQTYPNAFRYIFSTREISWMGAFSEVLGKFDKRNNSFETMSLAGTISVSENWTSKEIEEQKPVSLYIRNILKNYSENIEESETYDHISGNIKHLRTDFKALINAQDLEKIIAELHPTPAVCGIPKEFCAEIISKAEKFPRELYAGFIKIETEDFTYFFVNLRCAKLYRNAVHAFVGGGITVESNPQKEWRETELKSEAILKNLVIKH
ncbi:chorismate-binding protein [Chryseobacterium sp.]|uniref:chorismate-binding protein n=1 Tax=Chryseobacterium sp. TaxID=1871047 RepID=UPI0028996894|nr:chorismate-binding protein [Chryseobacterium sp.]